MRSKVSLGLLALLLVALLIVPGIAQVPKNVLIIGMDTAETVDLAPARIYEFVPSLVLQQLYDYLVTFKGGADAFEKVVPGLAESWGRSEDGLTWTFYLRKNAKFHSGNPVNADAVVFSLRRSLERNEAPSWILSQFVPKPEMIQKIDEYTVAITTTQALGELLMGSIFAFQGICSILDPAVVNAHATTDDPYAVNWLADHDAGSGPFILKEWIRTGQFVLEAFPDYWGGKPKLDTIIIKDMPESTNQKMLLEKGDIDIAWDLLPEQIKDVESKEVIDIERIPSFFVNYLAMNVGYEPLSYESVRDAIRYAIDYDAIIEGIMEGAAIEGQTFIPAGMFAHLDLIPYGRDLDKARNLMKEAGYEEGFDVKVIVQPTPMWYSDIAVLIKENLADINIEVEIRTVVAAELYETYRAQEHQMIIAQWGADYADPDALAKPFAHCRTAGTEAEVRQLAWRNMYCPTGVTDWVEEAIGEKDSRKREVLYKSMQAVILDEGPFAILFYPLTQIAVRDRVKGLQLPPMWYCAKLSEVYKTE